MDDLEMLNIKHTANYALSFPCIYPVCPISIDHARLYLVGDILARYHRAYNECVIFPIGFHYSGLTAHRFCAALNSKEDNEIRRIFENVYNCHPHIISYLKENPQNILNYYSLITLQDLKKINISADYEEYYTTDTPQYNRFVLTFFKKYEKNKLLIKSSDNMQLDYNNKKWQSKMLNWSDNVSTIRKQEKIVLLNSKNDLKNGWNILKSEGIGVKWSDNRIIDSMHDSELLSLYDIVNHISKKRHTFTQKEMDNLFDVLSGDTHVDILPVVSDVLSFLPTSLLVMEEHLKVWFIKKLYTESLLFDEKYRTKNFFVLGLGMKDNKRMSSSSGTAVLLQDLISNYGSLVTRMIILMAGGHPSSFYNYENSTEEKTDKLFQSFKWFINSALLGFISTYETDINKLLKTTDVHYVLQKINTKPNLKLIFEKLDKLIQDGFFKQCLIELMSILPKTYKKSSIEDQRLLLIIINFYVKILLGVTILEL